jgi:glycosyltransferase involved in cell wall biosynthesis
VTESPKVSVIVPSYQRASLLPRTLETLVAQTICEPYEVIVVDDGSTEGTRGAVTPFLCRNVGYERIEHAGLPAPINRGLELATGEYVMLCNDHDLYAPELLQELSHALDKHPRASMAVSDVVLLSADASTEIETYRLPYQGLIDGRRFTEETLLPGLGSIASCVMFRRSALGCGDFDATFEASADVELWLRLAGRGDVVYVAQPLSRVRDRDAGSAFFFANHRLVLQALRAKRAHMPAGLEARRRRAIEAGWAKAVDRSAALSLTRCLEAGRMEELPSIRALIEQEGTKAGALAIRAVSSLPRPVARAVLHGLRGAGRSRA